MSTAKPNIVLINLDGLRQDKASLVPSLSDFVKENIYFENIIASAPYTVAALHSVLSGLYPSKNGLDAYYHLFSFKKNECKTLQQYLQENGYYTAADVIHDKIIPAQGFDNFMVFKEGKDNLTPRHEGIIKESAKIGKPFFLFFDFSDLHRAAVEIILPESEKKGDLYYEQKDLNTKRYEELLPLCSNYVNTIINTLKQLDLYDKTILIFFSDHGISLGERNGEPLYGVFLYDYSLKCFCSIRIPKYEGIKIKHQCRLIDIMPTLLDLVNIEHDGNMEKLQGESLIPLVEGREKEDRATFSETGGLGGPWPSPKAHNVFCVRWKDKKIIYNKTPKSWEFYDLDKDPKEQNNIYDENNEKMKEYQKKLLDMMGSNNIKYP